MSCEGENPADVENIKARDYYPRMGFPYYYFPFKNIEGYIPPIVAVQFTVESKCPSMLSSNPLENKTHLNVVVFLIIILEI